MSVNTQLVVVEVVRISTVGLNKIEFTFLHSVRSTTIDSGNGWWWGRGGGASGERLVDVLINFALYRYFASFVFKPTTEQLKGEAQLVAIRIKV